MPDTPDDSSATPRQTDCEQQGLALRQRQAQLEERLSQRTAELARCKQRLNSAVQQQQALTAIVELSPAVAFRFRNEPHWTLEYVSENISQFGYSADDFLTGRFIWPDVTHADDRSELITSLQPDDREGRVEYRATYRIRTAAGKWRWVDDHTMALRNAAGEITHFQGIIVDVTEQRKAQRSLLRSERMAAVGMLAAGVAHEFNNVFTSMLGYIQLAQETPGLPTAAKVKLERTLKIGQRASTITQNLLAYTRSWQGVARTHPIDELIRASVASVETALRDAEIELVLDPDSRIQVSVDSALFDQLLVNLLVNAQHALLGRPEKRIRIRTSVEANHCCMRVEDTGCGIPADARERLYLPFFTTKGEHAAADSPQADVRGTGLGLSICDTIVRQHGGSIAVESEVDVGTTMVVTLPLAAEPVSTPGPGTSRS